ncbi:hypothetical protein [Falsiroseomonas sp. HW251]|uniref:hypothetical protein n=1 Tax=Falsiroseomonas sp. HW251 TaxID=3390998 RepID=UPI003D310BFD
MPHAWRRLPIAVRFLFSHGALGFAAAGLFVGGLLVTDPNGAGTLLLTGAGHWWPLALLWGLTGSTFAGVQIGIAIMLMGEQPAPGPPGGNRAPGGPAPARIPVQARRR